MEARQLTEELHTLRDDDGGVGGNSSNENFNKALCSVVFFLFISLAFIHSFLHPFSQIFLCAAPSPIRLYLSAVVPGGFRREISESALERFPPRRLLRADALSISTEIQCSTFQVLSLLESSVVQYFGLVTVDLFS